MRISDWSSDVCSSDLAASLTRAASLASAASLPNVPSTAVMLSVMVPMSSVMFMSVTRVLSVVVSVLSPQADTARAAPATNVPITSLERIARICRSEEHTSELQSLMRISYAVVCLNKKHTHQKAQN